MYKILIADDEEKVCQLISKIIDWESLGIDIVGVANDGKTALNLIMKELPDIVITDIRMPGYDGLELIAKAKEVKSEIRFIIISGYRQFDYARNAIKYGVEDYLLKPIREEELLDIIVEMLEKVKNQKQNLEEKQDMQKQIATDAKRIRSNFLEHLLEESKKLPDSLDIKVCNQLYHCNFKKGYYQAIVIKPDISRKEYNSESYQILLRRAQSIAENILREEEGVLECLTIATWEGIFFLLNRKEADNQLLRKKLTQIKNSISGLRDLFWNIQVTIGVGVIIDDFKQLPKTIKTARNKTLSRVFYGKGMILQADEYSKEIIKVNHVFDIKIRKLMLEYLESQNTEEVCQILENVENKLIESKIQDGDLLLNLLKEILDVFLFAMKNIQFQEEHNDIQMKILHEFHMCTSAREIFEMLRSNFSYYLTIAEEEKKKSETKPIRDAKKFIAENFAKPLRLEDIGTVIGFNATYFSALFKKETGKNFSEYLIEIRIHKAKELLLEEKMSVMEVAEKVGYSDLKYFTKIFRKETGLNPSEFRKMYR